MLKFIVLALAVALAAILLYAATRPGETRVTRSLAIHAAPEKLYALVEDFHAWTAWSPYEKLDPQMQRLYEGAERGKGAAYAWQGNGKAGAGRMRIVDAAPSSRLGIVLDFSKPFVTSNQVEFTFVPRGDATEVTWSMQGPTPYMAKLMGLFFDMDAMIGRDFESGLASLRGLAEHPDEVGVAAR